MNPTDEIISSCPFCEGVFHSGLECSAALDKLSKGLFLDVSELSMLNFDEELLRTLSVDTKFLLYLDDNLNFGLRNTKTNYEYYGGVGSATIDKIPLLRDLLKLKLLEA